MNLPSTQPVPPPAPALASPSAPPSALPQAPAAEAPLGQAEAMVRLIEAAHQVRRRYQFFVWTQSHLQTFVPHRLAVCGAYQRHRRAVTLELFNGMPLPPQAEATLVDIDSPLLQALVRRWVSAGGRPVAQDLAVLDGVDMASRDVLCGAGLVHWLVHGVARPQRPHELESLFLFSSPGRAVSATDLAGCDLLMPQVHAAYLRMQDTEREMGLALPPAAPRVPSRTPITPRERQILTWVREGKSNHQIGEELGISPLTVKNHVQKILRKLDASNRAQAVAKAMALNLLSSGDAPCA